MPSNPTVKARYGEVPGLSELLSRHPGIHQLDSGSQYALEFGYSHYRRWIQIGYAEYCPVGVSELFDNNPIVCAQGVCLPTPAATLSLLAIGPIIRAGLLASPFTILTTDKLEAEDLAPFLSLLGSTSLFEIEILPKEDPSEITVKVDFRIKEGVSENDVLSLYEETYERSLLVSPRPGKTIGACYQAKIESDLCEIQMQSSIAGKAGAAQIVHVLNIMAGYEDSLGLG